MSITKEQLAKKYNSMKSKDLCSELGISYPTLRNLLIEAGIPLKGRGVRPLKIQIKGSK